MGHPHKYLARIFAKRGLSQVEVSKKTGISRAHINGLLKGKVPLSRPRLKEICEKLPLDTDEAADLIVSWLREQAREIGSATDRIEISKRKSHLQKALRMLTDIRIGVNELVLSQWGSTGEYLHNISDIPPGMGAGLPPRYEVWSYRKGFES